MLYEIRVKIDEGGYMPVRGHEDDAGLDLRTPCDVVVPAGGSAVIDTKTHILIPKGYYAELRGRSGLHVKHDIVCFGGTIDAGFLNSITVKLYNMGKDDFSFSAGDRIVQLVIMKCETPALIQVEDFSVFSARGYDGIGSTGLS